MNSTVSKGIVTYKVKFPKKTEKIGFFNNEVIWNLLEDAGPKGMSITELRQQSTIGQGTVYKIVSQLLNMRRLKRTTVIRPNGLPMYYYLIRRRWLNVK
jgi:predicted transcriptional regulator